MPARLSIGQPLRRRTALLGAFSALTLTHAAATPSWAADLARPSVIACATWGAAPPRTSISWGARPTHLAIHHTATPNRGPQSLAVDHAFCRSIQREHLSRSPQIRDTLHNFTVTQAGRILEGRHRSLEAALGGARSAIGGHIRGGDAANEKAVGIENEGMFTSTLPPQAEYRALVHLCTWLCRQYAIPVAHIQGHRDFPGQNTACCGDLFHSRLGTLRADVAATLATGVVTTTLHAGGSAAAYPTLRAGDSGAAVSRLQGLLNAAGHSVGAVDGRFGPATMTAVRSFQASRGQPGDGVAGPRTWCALLSRRATPVLRAGDSGEAVTRVQCALNARSGAGLTEDGRFGSATGAAVRAYQRLVGLADDGVVGSGTWGALSAGR